MTLTEYTLAFANYWGNYLDNNLEKHKAWSGVAKTGIKTAGVVGGVLGGMAIGLPAVQNMMTISGQNSAKMAALQNEHDLGLAQLSNEGAHQAALDNQAMYKLSHPVARVGTSALLHKVASPTPAPTSVPTPTSAVELPKLEPTQPVVPVTNTGATTPGDLEIHHLADKDRYINMRDIKISGRGLDWSNAAAEGRPGLME